jgi:hypothetical protein
MVPRPAGKIGNASRESTETFLYKCSSDLIVTADKTRSTGKHAMQNRFPSPSPHHHPTRQMNAG